MGIDMKTKMLKAVECAYLLDVNITEFLELERTDQLPKSFDIGIGRRWRETEVIEYKKKLKLS
tara:strand:- start:3245 stop:3433 length:189 start_codon:yes stop_codon:yes gene_type:complete